MFILTTSLIANFPLDEGKRVKAMRDEGNRGWVIILLFSTASYTETST